MSGSIKQFMTQFRTENDKYTHTSQMQPFVGKFNIEKSNIEKFWRFYCDNVFVNDDSFLSGISEKPNSYMPVLGDIDLQINPEDDVLYETNIYSLEQVKSIVKIYIDVLKYILKDLDFNKLICFVLEKKKPYIAGPIVKNGFHIHFPYIFMSQVDQEIHLLPRVIKEVENREIFKNLMQHSGDAIDKGVSKKHWLMYGSRKDSKLEAYKLTHILNCDIKNISLSEVMKIHSIYNSDEDEIEISSSSKPVDYFLPRILSINPLLRPTSLVKDNLEVTVKQKLIKAKEIKGTIENMPLQDIVLIAKKLSDCLSSKRASSYESWMEVGWVLYTLGDGCFESLEIWLQFSKKTTKGNFNEALCVYEWNKMYRGNYTLGTLKYYALSDNPDMYGAFLSEERTKRIKDSLNGGHFDLARQIHDTYGQHYMCASIEKDLWYEFKNHRWIKDEKGIELKRKIAAFLIPRYKDEAKKQYDEIGIADDGDRVDQIEHDNTKVVGNIKKINNIIGNLNTAGFKQSVMKECQELFYNSSFYERLDSDPYLIGFNNGILDLKTCSFRQGKADDYVSYTCGYDYKEYKQSDMEIQDLELNLEKIFVDPVLKEYFINYSAMLLKGGNFQKTFLVMSGEGDNGKSVIIEMIEKALGDYVIKFPTTLITGKRTQSSAANPELARIHGKRFAVLQEPDGKDVINSGILKELTGNDSIYVRGLFKEGREIKPMFKLALICNKLPHLSADDQATWNRVRVLLYESCFPKDSSKVPLTFEEQKEKKIFHRDNDFNEKIPFMRTAFMWYILQRYKELRNVKMSDMIDPPKVTEATRAYRENNDFFLQYVNENIKLDSSLDNTGLTLTEIYNNFVDWYKDTYTSSKAPNKIELREDLSKRWGSPVGGKWKTVRFKSLMDDDSQ